MPVRGFPNAIEIRLTPYPSVRSRPVDKILGREAGRVEQTPLPSLRVRPVDKILRGGGYPCREGDDDGILTMNR
jgi:hypothetical protein